MEPQADQPTDQVEAPVQTEFASENEQEMAEPEITPFSWQASEYVHHQKGPLWYVVLVIILAGLTAAAVITREWLAIAVFVCMFLAVAVYGSRQPRTLNYAIDKDGLRIEGKTYPFNNFSSFGVIQDVAWHSIDLEPTQRFMPRLTILLDDSHVEEIVGRLSSQLPRFDRKPDLIERAARYLRF